MFFFCFRITNALASSLSNSFARQLTHSLTHSLAVLHDRRRLKNPGQRPSHLLAITVNVRFRGRIACPRVRIYRVRGRHIRSHARAFSFIVYSQFPATPGIYTMQKHSRYLPARTGVLSFPPVSSAFRRRERPRLRLHVTCAYGRSAVPYHRRREPVIRHMGATFFVTKINCSNHIVRKIQ